MTDRNPLKKNETSFKKGISGNKRGRPKGAKNKENLLREVIQNKAQDMMLSNIERIVDVVCEKAREGDLTAAKMIMDRVVPIEQAKENRRFGGVNIVIGELKTPVSIEGEIIEET